MAIEKNAKEAVEAEFADELKNEPIFYKTIDISETKNKFIAEKNEVKVFPFLNRKWNAEKKTYKNLTKYVFPTPRSPPATFKNGVAEKVRTLLK